MPIRSRKDLPGTIQRSPAKAQRTYAKTLESAIDEYGDGERAHRTALAALKHSFEKVGDHWEEKAHRGPSDPRAHLSGRAARTGSAPTAGGVDVEGHTRDELMDRARRAGIRGRSRMNKLELGQALARRDG